MAVTNPILGKVDELTKLDEIEVRSGAISEIAQPHLLSLARVQNTVHASQEQYEEALGWAMESMRRRVHGLRWPVLTVTRAPDMSTFMGYLTPLLQAVDWVQPRPHEEGAPWCREEPRLSSLARQIAACASAWEYEVRERVKRADFEAFNLEFQESHRYRLNAPGAYLDFIAELRNVISKRFLEGLRLVVMTASFGPPRKGDFVPPPHPRVVHVYIEEKPQ